MTVSNKRPIWVLSSLLLLLAIFLISSWLPSDWRSKSEEKPLTQTRLMIDALRKLREQRSSQTRPNRTLDLVRRLPKNASSAQIESNLGTIITEIGRSTFQDRATVLEGLALLRGQRNSVQALVDVYASTPRDKFYQRALLLGILGELQRLESLKFLKSVVSDPLPPSSGNVAESITPREREEMIQMRAVASIAFIRSNKGEIDSAVNGEVLRIARLHPSHAVRLAAIDAYMWNHGDSREAAVELYQSLPPEYHKFIERPRFSKSMNHEVFLARLRAWRRQWQR